MKRAKNSAYHSLTIRPRSRTEIEKRLRDREFSSGIISTTIDHLLRLGYLDDVRFARQWAESRVRTRGFGRRRVEQELRLRGVGPGDVREALTGLFDDEAERETARREAEKKLRTLERFGPEVRRRRLAGYLERKGFPAAIIRDIVRSSVRGAGGGERGGAE